MDRATQGPVLVGSQYGGMDIETVASENPDAIHTLSIDVSKGLDLEDAKNLARDIGFTGNTIDDVINFKVFISGRIYISEII